MSSIDFSNDSMLDLYLFESTTLLDQLDEILLQSEKEEYLSSDNVNEIFRIMHTIKGSSAMMEFDIIAHVSHKLEDLFFLIRENGISDHYFNELFDLILKVSDFLKEEIDEIRQEGNLSSENDSLVQEIESFIDKIRNQNLSSPDLPLQQVVVTESPSLELSLQDEEAEEAEEQDAPVLEVSPEEQMPEGQMMTYHLHIYFTEDCQMENVRALMIVNKLEAQGKVLATIPQDLTTAHNVADTISRNGFYLSFSTTSLSQKGIEDILIGSLSVKSIDFISELPHATTTEVSTDTSVQQVETQNKEKDKGQRSASDSSVAAANKKTAKQNLINVDLNKLDVLMDLVEEIVITESMLSVTSDEDSLKQETFNKISHQLGKLTDELQDIVMSIRMIPISSTFQKMRRIIRDMGKKLEKEVDLVLIGETTEVDKAIIDSVADPLMHLVRNAMDHAIEPKSVRIAAKKNPVGKITLSAENLAGDIIICVKDDGKGLDADAIMQKAKEKNLLTKPEHEYSEKEIYNLLMVPGFSTKDAVTEFSGRGVGMDVVRRNIEKIGGSVTIESVKGVGTTISCKIPLTLAIISSMHIRVGQEIYAIPISNIRESFKASPKQLFSDPDNNEMIMIRGSYYPILRLHKIFGIEDSVTNIPDGILLLVESEDSLACLFADELMGKHQIVVKPLPIYLNRFAINGSRIAGCTILGNGKISLIPDVQRILRNF